MIAVYRALREGTHAERIGFRASPLVVAGLSAGGNLAVASVISPLVRGPSRTQSAATSQVASTATSRMESEEDEPWASDRGGGAAGGRYVAGISPPVLMPDAMLLLCPVLNLNRSPSPSRVAFCSDT